MRPVRVRERGRLLQVDMLPGLHSLQPGQPPSEQEDDELRVGAAFHVHLLAARPAALRSSTAATLARLHAFSCRARLTPPHQMFKALNSQSTDVFHA